MKRKDKTINYSIRNKLFIYLAIIGIIPAFIMIYVVYRYSYEKDFYDKCIAYDNVIYRLVSEMEYLDDITLKDESIIRVSNGKKYFTIEYIYDRLGVSEEEMNIIYTRTPAKSDEGFRLFKDSYYYSVPVNENDDVYLTIEINKNPYLKQDKNLEEIFFRGMAIHAIFVTASSFIISYYLSKDLFNITANIRNMTKTNDTSHNLIHIKELKDIENEVSTMLETKEKLINQNYNLELENKQTHIKMLQSQISPHFLYNALDSINWRLIENGDLETSKILISLSKTLRYSIDDSKDLVPLSTEMEEIGNYLVVQKNRYYDSFNYEITLDDSVKDFLIPKMTIQPLVENSLKHGLDGVEDAFILVQATRSKEYIYISVYDNGKGMSEEKKQEILDALYNDNEIYYGGRNHIGLKNTYLRLTGYMPDCKFILDTVENEFTMITLRLEVTNEITNC